MTKTAALTAAEWFAFVIALCAACFGTAAILLAHGGHLPAAWTDRGAIAVLVGFVAYIVSDLLAPYEDEPAEVAP